jgi:tetratricopeptide (TPR) repeat protein
MPAVDDMAQAEIVDVTPVAPGVADDIVAAESVEAQEMAAEMTPPAIENAENVDEMFALDTFSPVAETSVETVPEPVAVELTPSPQELEATAHQDMVSALVAEKETAAGEDSTAVADATGPVSGASVHQGAVAELAEPDDGPDTYYDSAINVPQSQLTESAGPRKLDPTQEPASKYVISHKTHSKSSQESMLVSANRALKLQRYEAAEEMFGNLYAKNARDTRILMGYALALQKVGKGATAIGVYEELLDIAPDNAPALINLMGLIREQYPSVALRRLIDLQDRYPDNAGIAAQIGVTQGDLQNYDEALRSLGVAASLEPRNAQHPFNMAIIAERMGDKTAAIKLYEEALETDAVYGKSRSVPRETIYDRLHVLRR